MSALDSSVDLSPPPVGRWSLPLALAVLVHALLVLLLSASVSWQREPEHAVVVAELWAQLPQAAALQPVPEPVDAAPSIAPPAPEPPAAEPPTPAPVLDPAPAPSPLRPADIALEQRRAEQQRQAERAEQRRQAERAERELQAQLEAERQRNLERIMGRAAATGPAASGNAAVAAGPSATYAARLVAAIRPNIVFTDFISSNPRAEVELRALPDGSILSARLLQSSGYPAWDAAVLRAIERTARLPRDVDGRVPSVLILGFRPHD